MKVQLRGAKINKKKKLRDRPVSGGCLIMSDVIDKARWRGDVSLIDKVVGVQSIADRMHHIVSYIL
jgi:hypothetical protein